MPWGRGGRASRFASARLGAARLGSARLGLRQPRSHVEDKTNRILAKRQNSGDVYLPSKDKEDVVRSIPDEVLLSILMHCLQIRMVLFLFIMHYGTLSRDT
ncbi:unnamed protein product [Victoria cruziana]